MDNNAPTEIWNGTALGLWRERMGFSQREAATRLGCSRDALASWEAGDTRLPKYIALAAMALALGIEADMESADTSAE